MLNDNVLTTFVFCVGHNRDVFVNTVYNFLGDSTLSSLVHCQHNARRLPADELSMGVTVGGLSTLWPFSFAPGFVVSPGAGDLFQDRDFGRSTYDRVLALSGFWNRCLALRTCSRLWGLSDGVVRL